MYLKIIALTLTIAVAVGCATKGEYIPTTVPSAGYKSEIEAYKRQEEARSRPNPSLWSDVGSSGTMFLDYKARKIGDIVIVNIVESASASNSSSASNSKSAEYSTGVTAMLGLPIAGVNDFLGSGSGLSPNIGATTNNTYSGAGSISKSDTVRATLAARIIDIMPSGNLVIEGNREIIIDRDKQTITLRGIIRQKDIDAKNTVVSSVIADAQITYSGAGTTTQATKKGWLGSFLDIIAPF